MEEQTKLYTIKWTTGEYAGEYYAARYIGVKTLAEATLLRTPNAAKRRLQYWKYMYQGTVITVILTEESC